MDSVPHFPIKKDQTYLQRGAILLAILMSMMSIIGLIWPHALYPGEGQVESYVVNDLVNVLIGLPGVLLAVWWIKRGKLLGVLFLPGAMLYIFYNYIAYVFGADFSGWTAAWGILVLGSGILFFRLLFNLDTAALKDQLKGKVPAIFAGIVLAIFGAAFAGLAFNILNSSELSLPHPDLGLALADIVVSLIWLAGGILLLLKKPAGFAWGGGLLYAAVLLFVGVILLVVVRPLLIPGPFALDEFVTLTGMAVICFVPFGLFVRGIMKKEHEGNSA